MQAMAMTNEDWKYKIINASPKRLVIVTYEIILSRINEASELLDKGDIEGFRAKTGNAREFVSELMCSLDMSEGVSIKLADLYILVNKLLTKAYFRGCGSVTPSSAGAVKQNLRHSAEILERLMRGLEKEVDDQKTVSAEVCGNYSNGFRPYAAPQARQRRL